MPSGAKKILSKALLSRKALEKLPVLFLLSIAKEGLTSTIVLFQKISA